MDRMVAQKPLMSERRVGIIGAMLVMLGPISMSLYTPAMPDLVHAFGTTDAAINLTLSVYFGGFAVAQLFTGPLSDAFGRRRVSLVFMSIYLAASIAAALSPSVGVLVAARLVQGIGASAGIATSRAIVRDLFTGEQSSRIMNLIGVLLAVGPALAPTIGGVTLALSGWRTIFLVMVVFGAALVAVILFAMRESGRPDPSLIRPRQFLASYWRLVTSARFMAASVATGISTGGIYALATILPFVLINRAGLSPEAFGVGMVAQTGSYFVGSLLARSLIRRHGADSIVPFGLLMVAVGAALLSFFAFTMEPTYLSVMGPVGCYAFGISFVMPAMTTAALHPFPQIAGAASAMMGFIQMGSGFVGGAAVALFADPVVAMAVVIPALAAVSIAGYAVYLATAGRTPRTAEPRGRLLP